MLRKRTLSLAATALGAIAMLFVTAGDAQARRGFYRGPVGGGYYAPYGRGVYYGGPRAYRTGYRGGYYSPYGYGYGRGYGYGGYYGRGGGVVIGGPGVGVSVGW